MGAELQAAEEEGARVFSARKVRARLRADHDAPVAAFRGTLDWGRERLINLFHDGESAESLVRARAQLVDEVLAEAWDRHMPEAVSGVALAAVGGYGRGELLPSSDIDLLILHDGEGLERARKALEQLTAFFWDIGLEVGSSVRSMEDCVGEAAKDITVITNMMEARFLTGDRELLDRMQARLTPERLWPVAEFFRAKKSEQEARYRKYDDTGYKLEPNVKESPGGLRDIHTISWVARRHFGASTLGELRDHGFLTKQECDELFAGQDFLWRVRFALHMITGRREDRLLFDHQVSVAGLFGYINTDPDHPNQAVEQFMQLYYRTIKSLSCLNDMLLQLFEEAILHPLSDAVVKVINPRFQIRNGFLEARDDDVFRKSPQSLIEMFLLMQQRPGLEGIRAQTVRMILRDSRLLTEEVRRDVRTRALFMEMFREGRGLTRNLRRMNRYGVLGRYLPAFGRIVGLMQYDLFHTLTVDEHILYVVRNLRRFAMERFATELPFCSSLMARLGKPEVLYLAGFFHDMAKGRGGDHSDIGADEARTFCLDHGLSHADAELVAWLVKNHLVMSLTAQRADISDPDVIADFARKVGDRTHLDFLLLLTVADIRATNPALWNSWRASLLMDLYKATSRALERGQENPLRQEEMVAETQRDTLTLLARHGVDESSARSVWMRFGDEYFLRHSAEELAWHFPAIRDARDADLPLVLVENVGGRGTTVFVYMRDRDHLFALCTGVLSRLGLNILDARINTTADDFVLDSFVVMEGDGTAIQNAHRFDEILHQLREVLSDSTRTAINVNRRISQRLRNFNTPTSVYFSQDPTRERTVLELVTGDQPGLLSMIGRVFHRRGIRVDAAKIATIGERAEDVFFITDRKGRPIRDPHTLDQLAEVLTRTLDRSDN